MADATEKSSRLHRKNFKNLNKESWPSATAGPPHSTGSEDGKLRKPSSRPPSAKPPQPRESRPARVTSPSHPGGGKADPFTRAQECGLGTRGSQRQPTTPGTKSRRTRETLAPRDTLKARRWERGAPMVGASSLGSAQLVGRSFRRPQASTS